MGALLTAVVSIFAVPLGSRVWELPREVLLYLGIPAIAAYSCFNGFGVMLPETTLTLLIGLIVWSLATSTLVKNPRVAIAELTKFALIIALAVVTVSTCDVVSIYKLFIVAGCINAFAVCIQTAGVPFPSFKMMHPAGVSRYSRFGTAGNSNFAGHFLVPLIFLSFHVGWIYAGMFMLIGLALTKCKGAIAAAVAGFLYFISPWLVVPLIGIVCVAFHRYDTFQQRLKYLHIAWQAVKKHPIFGIGVNQFKIIVYDLYDEVGKEKLDRMFNRTVNIPPLQCHNDFVQAWLDFGIFGLLFLISAYVFALLNCDPSMTACLVSLIVASLTMKQFYIVPLRPVIAIILLSVFKTDIQTVYIGGVLPALLCLSAIPFCVVVFRQYMSDVYFNYAFREYVPEVDDALKWDENNHEALSVRAMVNIKAKKDYCQGFIDMVELCQKYDGVKALSGLKETLYSAYDLVKTREPNPFKEVERHEPCR